MIFHVIYNVGTIRLLLRILPLLIACSAGASDCSRATILVNVFKRSPSGNVDTVLDASDLNVEVDGKRPQILSLSLDKRPRRIVLMLDTSGSMQASPQRRGWGIVLPTAAYAVEVLPANSSVALVTFADALHLESVDFENGDSVAAKVSDLKRRRPLGRTLLFDSIHQVLNDFPKLQSGDAIFLVSDGADNESKTSVRQLRKELINRGIRVFVFLVVQDEFQSSEETEGTSRTQDLALSTGGAVLPISWAQIAGANRAQLDKVAPVIRAQVESFYSLELGVSANVRSGRVKVSFADKKREKNSIIAFSHQVDLCPAAISAGN